MTRARRLALIVIAGASLALVAGGRVRAARPQPPVKLFPSTMPEESTVKVTLVANPPAPRVLVLWGKRRLGFIMPKQPLVLQRPRDSGPMDLVLQSDGFLPVQTRAFTFGDNKITVKLTPLAEKNTLIGYRQELPPDVPPGVPPDGGAPFVPDAGGQ
ncbi:MAG TPA: hypothetical protein VHJ20_14350 [Polyangia bacterium]|nr:hypothetical protein [Polyangia bacterium]